MLIHSSFSRCGSMYPVKNELDKSVAVLVTKTDVTYAPKSAKIV